jgi:hypothetical protein
VIDQGHFITGYSTGHSNIFLERLWMISPSSLGSFLGQCAAAVSAKTGFGSIGFAAFGAKVPGISACGGSRFGNRSRRRRGLLLNGLVDLLAQVLGQLLRPSAELSQGFPNITPDLWQAFWPEDKQRDDKDDDQMDGLDSEWHVNILSVVELADDQFSAILPILFTG